MLLKTDIGTRLKSNAMHCLLICEICNSAVNDNKI